jgi:K+-sensing histidine kinase KdpD
MLSLFLSEIAHIRLPVYLHVHLYAAIFAATRIAGVVVGIIALGLTLVFSDYFLTEPVYELFPIYDLPDYVTFSLAAAGAIWIGYLGRKMADSQPRN